MTSTDAARAPRPVLVVIRRALSERRAGQGLRAAVAYAALGLDVTVALCGPQDAPPGSLCDRHLQTLRALGHPVIVADAEGLCRLVGTGSASARFATVVVW